MPVSQETKTSKEAWLCWRRLGHDLRLKQIDAPVYERVLEMWAKIEAWTTQNKPSIRESLAPGASARDFEAFEKHLGLELPDIV